MVTRFKVRLQTALFLAVIASPHALAQAPSSAPAVQPPGLAAAEQTAQILGLDVVLGRLGSVRAQHPCGSIATPEEISIRQDLLESIQASILDVDGVLGEIANERNELTDLRTSLQSRRDRTVGLLNSAALITGSGLGVAVNATQFTSLGSRTQNVGDAIGIGSGTASTILSLIAARRQRGPNGSVGDTPNMLAPFFGGTPVLNTYYPPAVLQYLRTVPAGGEASGDRRLDQLRAQWVKAGRLNASASVKQDQKIAALSTSMNPSVKVSIDDLSNRIAMLGDVSGRVSLMKRDLSMLMRSYASKSPDCAVHTGQAVPQ